MSDNTAVWLRELGAVSLVAPPGSEGSSLGEFRDGYYPLKWVRYWSAISRDCDGNRVLIDPIEEWTLFGVPLGQARLTREVCVRILERCK